MKRLISSPNTRFKISEKVTVLLLVMVLVAVVNITVIYSYHQQVEDAGNSVNIAGQQRMLSQRMLWFASDIAHGENPDLARDRLRVSIDRYDRNLNALLYGGRVADTQLNPGSETDDTMPSVVLRGEALQAPPPAAQDELAAEAEVWEEYKPHIVTVLNADPESEAFQESLAYVRAENDRLLATSDAATAELTEVIRVERQALQRMLVVLLGVDILVALLGSMFARQYLGKPMAAIATKGLRLADGDLDSDEASDLPVDHSIPLEDQRSELARLSRAFDEVQEYLQTVSGQSRALAARDFDAEIFEAEVPGELGVALETMHDDIQEYIHDLQTTTEKLDAIIEASPAAIYITDTRGNVQRWNPAATRMFGWEESAVLGQHNPTIPDDGRDDYRTLRSRVLAGESLTGVERRRITKSGERIDVSISTATVAGPDGDIEGVMTVVEDISERKERERMLRRQRDDLELMGRVTDIVLDITRELVESSDQDRIEELVCMQLADAERYATTWIGESLGSADELAFRIGATESGAVMEDYEDCIEMDIGRRAAIRAMESGEVQVREIPDEATGDPETATAGEVAAFPLSHRGSVYGVLVVQTLGGFSFREQELAGLATLGKTIGFARSAITNKKLLFADSVVDLRFTVDESALPFVETTASLDCRAWLDGLVVSTTDDSVTVYLGIEETTAAEFAAAVVDEPDVGRAWVIADESTHKRVGVTLDDTASLGRLSHQEVTLHDIELDAGSGVYGFEAPLSVEVSAIVEDLQEWYPGIQLRAKREKDKPITTAADVATTMESTLTDRQFEIFKTAYYSGYFEWPRDSTIEELAESLGIAGSTFHHHLRHAQRKLATALLHREDD